MVSKDCLQEDGNYGGCNRLNGKILELKIF